MGWLILQTFSCLSQLFVYTVMARVLAISSSLFSSLIVSYLVTWVKKAGNKIPTNSLKIVIKQTFRRTSQLFVYEVMTRMRTSSSTLSQYFKFFSRAYLLAYSGLDYPKFARKALTLMVSKGCPLKTTQMPPKPPATELLTPPLDSLRASFLFSEAMSIAARAYFSWCIRA